MILAFTFTVRQLNTRVPNTEFQNIPARCLVPTKNWTEPDLLCSGRWGRPLDAHLAAVLLGAVWAADGGRGDGAGQLGVGAEHGVRLSRARRPQLPDAGRELGAGVVLQDVGLPLAGALVHLRRYRGGDHGVAKAGFGFAVGTQDLALFIRT